MFYINCIVHQMCKTNTFSLSLRFVEGFKTLGLLKELQKNPIVFHDIFMCEEKPVTARDLSSLFTVAYFAQGSNRRALENQLVCFWRDWLIDIEVAFFHCYSL
ncbi:hypothetical protein ILYODFUR_022629 [Ilyodon furcidens]|uniref:Uncharacterized protein n=1 Tax=Ilyodon furcidens TaxID=33524 RepID=A0ABV0SNH3_9TELE